MSTARPEPLARAADLRRRFDWEFAEAPAAARGPQLDLLAVNVGGDAYAIRLSEVSGLLTDKRITRLPGSVAGLVGVMGVRGSLVPVYDLRTLLGYPRAPVARWLLVAAAAPVAVAFDRFDAHLRVPLESVSARSARGAATPSPLLREVVRTDAIARPMISMTAVLDAIALLARRPAAERGSDR